MVLALLVRKERTGDSAFEASECGGSRFRAEVEIPAAGPYRDEDEHGETGSCPTGLPASGKPPSDSGGHNEEQLEDE